MSEIKNRVPKSILEEVKCMQCKQYLSVPPIITCADFYMCGRCTSGKMKNENMQRALAYEVLARTVLFPCRFDVDGCENYCSFEETLDHENKCPLKASQCPVKNCVFSIGNTDILKHFHETHEDLILNSNSFTIERSQTGSTFKLMIMNDRPYLLETFVCDTLQKFHIDLYHFGVNPQATSNNTYQVEVSSQENPNVCIVLNQQELAEYRNEITESGPDLLAFDTIKALLKTDNFMFQLKFVMSQSNQNDNLLEELECFVCKEYMSAPIFICKTGHSVCHKCRSQIVRCHTCNAPYDGARNFVLEKLTEQLEYPCRNNIHGCFFRGSGENMRAHKTLCKTAKCPTESLDRCRWEGLLQDVYKHMKKAHPIRCLFKLDKVLFRNIKTYTKHELHVATYNENIFTVLNKYEANKEMSWTVKHYDYSAKEEPKYKFYIDFGNEAKKSFMLRVGSLCYGSKFCDDKALESYSIELPYGLLVPFIESGKLMYSISIENVEKAQV